MSNQENRNRHVQPRKLEIDMVYMLKIISPNRHFIKDSMLDMVSSCSPDYQINTCSVHGEMNFYGEHVLYITADCRYLSSVVLYKTNICMFPVIFVVITIPSIDSTNLICLPFLTCIILQFSDYYTHLFTPTKFYPKFNTVNKTLRV